jgi:hypothetical protein
MPLLDLCMQLRHALVVKRHFTTHQDIQDNAETPHVDLGPSVLLCLEQLWRSKVQTSAEGLQLAPRREQVAQTEIDNLDVARLADEDILNLQVAVDDAVAVAVVERTGNLAGELASLLLLETAMGDDVVEHLAAIHKLEQHVPVVVCPHDVFHAADVGVVEQADNGGFTGSPDFLGVVCSLAVGGALVLVCRLSGDDLDGHLLARLAVLRQLDLPHAAGANCLAQRPCSRARGGDVGPPLRRSRLHLAGGYSVGGHGRGCGRVRSIPRVAASARLGAGRGRGGAVLGFAAADVVVCEVALLPVVGGDVVQALGMAGAGRAGGGALRAMGAVRRARRGRRAAGRGVSHHRRRRWRCRGHGARGVGRRVQRQAWRANRRAGCLERAAMRSNCSGPGQRAETAAVSVDSDVQCEGACRGPAWEGAVTLAARRDEGALAVSQRPCIPRL